MSKKEIIFTGIVILVLLGLNPFFAKDEKFVVPSRMFHSSDWSVRFWNYMEQKEGPDCLILGNSRTMYAIKAHDFEKALSNHNIHITVKSLASQGGYFPFYRVLLEKMIPNQLLPKHIIFGLSIRDFNLRHLYRNAPHDHLVNSPAYLAHYSKTMNQAEILLRDVFAAVFPMLYFKSDLREMLFGKGVLPQISKEEIPNALARYKNQLKVLGKFDSNHYRQVFGENLQGDPPIVPAKALKSIAEKINKWRNDPEIQKARYKPSADFELENSKDSDSYKVFRYLKEKNVKVTIITIPSLHVGGVEDSYWVNKQFLRQLHILKNAFDNIVSVEDLNQEFQHSFQDIKHYFDGGEHFTSEAAKKIAAQLAKIQTCLPR